MDANTLALVKDALDHGVDPNAPIQKGRYLDSAIGRASQLADPGDENAQARALTVLKLLLEAGARIGTIVALSGPNQYVKPHPKL